ncbi:MAG: twitching motility protein PilT [Oscillochloris sp.]|nr:twitching motility protein PilT [Oscillochloris sp.]
MKVSLNFLVRIAGMLALAYIGWATGRSLSDPRPDDLQQFATQLLFLAGAGLGLLITPRLTIEPVEDLLRRSRSVPLADLFLIGAGVMLGLLFAVLITVPLASLPAPFNNYLPLGAAALLAYLGGTIFATRKRDVLDGMRNWRRAAPALTLNSTENQPPTRRFILDTSTIIDGRIAVVAQTGFLEGTLLVPGFVLAELQQLADSGDDLRRAKGRRGLELLNGMQKQSPLPIEVVNIEVSGATKVDDKLVAMARQYACPVITNDFNLNRVASLQGVKVLSLNQLSEAVRPPVIQDQRLQVMIRNEGNSRQQGVGYLEDGTPVIVEDARHLIGKTAEVVVIRLHQTQTGRLVFAQLAE